MPLGQPAGFCLHVNQNLGFAFALAHVHANFLMCVVGLKCRIKALCCTSD